MAGVLGEIHHLGCAEELRFIASIRLAEWQADLPGQVEDFCDADDDRWFDANRVTVAHNRALESWRRSTLTGGQFGPDPLPVHHTRWQRRLGAIAVQEVWHAWCEVELGKALGQLGAAFAAEVRAYPEWDDHCSGGLMLFGEVAWRANFVELQTELLMAPWPGPPGWGLHSPVYYTW